MTQVSRLRFSQSVDYMLSLDDDDDDLKLPKVKGALKLDGSGALSPRADAGGQKKAQKKAATGGSTVSRELAPIRDRPQVNYI